MGRAKENDIVVWTKEGRKIVGHIPEDLIKKLNACSEQGRPPEGTIGLKKKGGYLRLT